MERNAGSQTGPGGTMSFVKVEPLSALVVTLVVALAGCGDGGATPLAQASPTADATKEEEPSMPSGPPAGERDWQVLFDRANTDALRGYGMDSFPIDRWVVTDGELRTVPGIGVDLITRDQFDDFELEFEWRVAPGGNSGVIYRVAETPDPAWTTGPEYQVLDDDRHPDGRNPTTSAAALYDLIAPGPNKRLEPVGGFNTGRVVVRDGQVEHWLNDELVVSYGWDNPATRALVEASKFAPYDGFMTQDSGHVVFQHHGEEAAFRAIRIRALDGD